MNDFKFNRLGATVPESFNLTPKRGEELAMEFMNASQKILKNPACSSRDYTIEFLEIAKTTDEKAYALFSAGVMVQQMHAKNQEFESISNAIDAMFSGIPSGRNRRPFGF